METIVFLHRQFAVGNRLHSVRTSRETHFLFRLRLKITLEESTYPSRRPQCPSLSHHFLLVVKMKKKILILNTHRTLHCPFQRLGVVKGRNLRLQDWWSRAYQQSLLPVNSFLGVSYLSLQKTLFVAQVQGRYPANRTFPGEQFFNGIGLLERKSPQILTGTPVFFQSADQRTFR